MQTRAKAVFAAAALLVGVMPAPSPAQQTKVPFDYKADDAWNRIQDVHLSDDGRYAAYVLAPEDGNPTLIVSDLRTGRELREARGTAPHFLADGKFLVYTIRADNDELHRADREKKNGNDRPVADAAILTLETGAVETVARVKSVYVPLDAGADTVAFLHASPSPVPKAGASAAPSSPASAAPPAAAPASAAPASAAPAAAAKPSPTATPDALHEIKDGTQLTIDELGARKTTNFEDVAEAAISHDGAYVAFATQSKDVVKDGVSLYASGATADTAHAIARGAGHYSSLAFDRHGERLALLTDAATFSAAAPSYRMLAFDAPSATVASAREFPQASSTALPAGWTLSVNAAPQFSKDGRYVYVGSAPAPTPVPSGTPEPLNVDIWNARDLDLQSQQRKNADAERQRTYRAVVDLNAATLTQLATLSMRDVDYSLEPGVDIALGSDDRAYRRAESWSFGRQDAYAVPLAGGAPRLLAKGLREDLALAPDGRFAAYFDRERRAWQSIRLSDGRRLDLTANLHVPFYDERDDHPDSPPPYAEPQWIDGGREFVLRDRYDAWAIDPESGKARNLTRGQGRRTHTIFVPVITDREATSFDRAKPIVLLARNEETEQRELWTLRDGTLRRLTAPPRALFVAAVARTAQTMLLREESSSTPEDLYWMYAPGKDFERLSNANPQAENYHFGREHLITYRTKSGQTLQGIVMTPDASYTGKRPMLVYFYERLSDQFPDFPRPLPAPGTSPNLLRYVSNGYVVFVPDVAYRTGHPGESALDCVLSGVDAAAKFANVDPKRIGIAGHSWAAYQIAYMITKTNRFAAAEAGAAVADMVSAYGGIRLESGVVREGQYEYGQSRMGAPPWNRIDLYIENSAIFHAPAINTPYLSIANDLDGAVPWLQGIELNTALRRLDKEAYMFSFDGEDHNLVGRENQKYWTVHLDEFFDHFLLGKPTPSWMSQGVDFLHRGQRNVRALYGEPALIGGTPPPSPTPSASPLASPHPSSS